MSPVIFSPGGVMPIRPENRRLYPGGSPTSKEWKAIRASILERARHVCEECGTPNGSYVTRDAGKVVRIVLTIAHIDHDPTNNDPANLRAWCQKHHLAHDHRHHMASSAATRRKKLPQMDMFP
jgi:5-methylcytosine-specific restriction endonuclease McrA